MKPQTTRELLTYVKVKTNVFDEAAKIKTHKKLNKTLNQFNETWKALHGRNLFFYNPLSQTLSTLDHLFITPKGLYLVNYIPMQKHVVDLDAHWWQNERTGEATPNEDYRLGRVGVQLQELLFQQFKKMIPFTSYVVSDQSFIPYLETPLTICEQLNQGYHVRQDVLSDHEMKQIQEFLIQVQSKTIESYTSFYDPDFVSSGYNPFKGQGDLLAYEEIYLTLDNIIYNEVEQGCLFHRLTIPYGNPSLIQTVLLSEKGLMLFQYLSEGVRVEVDLDSSQWSQFNLDHLTGERQPSIQIPNPIQVLETQAHHLLRQLPNPEVTLTYRIIGMEPIDLELKHLALGLSSSFEHLVDRYLQSYPDYLTESEVLKLKMTLSNWK